MRWRWTLSSTSLSGALCALIFPGWRTPAAFPLILRTIACFGNVCEAAGWKVLFDAVFLCPESLGTGDIGSASYRSCAAVLLFRWDCSGNFGSDGIRLRHCRAFASGGENSGIFDAGDAPPCVNEGISFIPLSIFAGNFCSVFTGIQEINREDCTSLSNYVIL